MARIDLNNLAHSYLDNPTVPEDYAIRPMDLTWQDGGAYALLGPSGCGKTTLLNIISGLLKPSQGEVHFDGEDVTGLSPEARNIAQVFQLRLRTHRSGSSNPARPRRNWTTKSLRAKPYLTSNYFKRGKRDGLGKVVPVR